MVTRIDTDDGPLSWLRRNGYAAGLMVVNATVGDPGCAVAWAASDPRSGGPSLHVVSVEGEGDAPARVALAHLVLSVGVAEEAD